LFMNSGDVINNSNTLQDVFFAPDNRKADFLVGNSSLIKKEKIVGIFEAPKEITAKYLYKDSICHQSSFIKTSLLKEVPYNENLKIVADWENFYYWLIIKNASYQKLSLIISKYNIEGLSSTNHQLNNEERESIKNIFFPERQKLDYERMTKGETYLEKVLCRVNERSVTYIFLTGIALFFWGFIKLKRVVLNCLKN
ncbi:hypothetical protein N9800_01025, partial [bacterium]|nr:hypothetical protein [bacterium]